MFNPIKAAGDAAKSVGNVAKKAADVAGNVARDPGKAFQNAAKEVKDTVADVAKSPGKALDAVQTGLDVAGFVPGVGIAADLANAGISAARGDMAGAALNAAAAIPIAGDALKGGKMAVKAVDAATTAAKATDKVGDAAKGVDTATDVAKGTDTAKGTGAAGAAGKTDEAAAAAKKAAAEAAQKRMDDLATQGHGPQRHGPQMTEELLDKRVREKLDPETGTRLDKYKPPKADGTPARHSCADDATRFNSNEAYVKAEDLARNSNTFKDASSKSEPLIEVRSKIEGMFGPNYKEEVYGRTRQAPWPDTTTPTRETDFTDGDVVAIYNRNARGEYDLVTMYPEPKTP